MEELNLITRTALELEQEGRHPAKLFSGNPVSEGFVYPPEILEESFKAFLSDVAYEPVSKGLLAAREAVCAFYARRDVAYEPEHIQLTCGTSESYHYLFSMLARPGDNVLMPCPSYPLLEHIGRMSGIELRHYPMSETNGWKIDLEALSRLIDRRTKAIVIISPHNPTGSVIGMDEIDTIAKLAARTGAALICDEVFSEFVFGGEKFPSAANCAHAPLVFTLDGLSKMCALPWLKLGWIAISGHDDKLVAKSLASLEMTADLFLSANSFAQTALPEILDKGQAFMQGYRRAVEKQKDLALSILGTSGRLSYVTPRGGFYVTAKIHSERIEEEALIVRLLKEYGLYAYPGYFFDIEPEPHLILSFLPGPKSLEPSLRKLVGALNELVPAS